MKRRVFVAVFALMSCDTIKQTVLPEPTFQRWNSAQAIEAFRAAGLELGEVTDEMVSHVGIAPRTEEDGFRFLIPSMGPDSGGRVYSFRTPENLEVKRRYYVELGRSNGLFYSHVFVRGNVLVQISGRLPAPRAQQYEQALERMP